MSAQTSSCRARLLVAYNGERFHGFAPSPGVKTVGSTIGDALSQIFQTEVPLVPAGRTDTGVHASGQVISCDLPGQPDLEVLCRQLNSLCGPQIVVKEITLVEDDFHARYSAIWRHYQYTVYNAQWPDPFLVATSWHVVTPINIRAMQLACDAIIGTHDFSGFCRRIPNSERIQSLRRNVTIAGWRDLGNGIFRFDIRANAFCHQMVRSLVGTFVDIGCGKRPSSDMMALIRSGDRAEASRIAPPQGLCLVEVGYPIPNASN